MPTYHYRCKSCKHEFEEFQSMSEDSLTLCPRCGESKLVRVISGAGLVFKGSGFYQTDYKNPGTGEGGREEKAGSKVEASKADPSKAGKANDDPSAKTSPKEKSPGKSSSDDPTSKGATSGDASSKVSGRDSSSGSSGGSSGNKT